MINSNEIILWCDVETTGTDAKNDKLLQVAALMTDERAENSTRPFQTVIKHNNASELRASSIDVVKNMHDATGLWSLLESGVELSTVDQILFDYINKNAPRSATIRLGGSSCRLDLNFIEEYLPKTYSRLTYRFLDVSGLAFALYSNGFTEGYMEKVKSHDAMDDITETIKEFKWLIGHLKK